MSYDFSTVVDRTNTGSKKWEQMFEAHPNITKGTLPMSVADMEFKTAPEIVQGVKDYLDEQILGYTGPCQSFIDSIVDWQKKRHNWDIEGEWIVNTGGVVAALNVAIRTLTQPGDGVIIFKPVYHPFSITIEMNQREEVNVPLISNDGHYTIDYAAFEEAAANPDNKLLLFCNPHNPVGRVWTKEELAKVAEIANKHQLFVCSDDIWNDIVMPGYEYTPLAKVNEDLHSRLITCTAPSKSFNIAGLKVSNIIISDPELRQIFQNESDMLHCGGCNALGFKACEIAYTQGEEWFEECLQVIKNNQEMVHHFFKEKFPTIKAPLIEGTFVQWVDFTQVDIEDQELQELLINEAEFIVNPGHMFGTEGEKFIRINLGLPSHELEKNLNRLGETLKKII